jgi:ankyrin repeat protein
MNVRVAILAAVACIFPFGSGAESIIKPVTVDRCIDVSPPTDFETTKQDIRKAMYAPGTSRIFRVLGRGQYSVLKSFLDAGDNPNVCNSGLSPLIMAVSTNDIRQANILLSGGAHADKPRDTGGGTALMLALEFGRYDMAELLLDRGADAAATRDGGGTTLFSLTSWPVVVQPAPDNRQLVLAKRLISGGASIDAQQGANRSTALMIAAMKGNMGLVSLLVERGADVSLKDIRGQTAEDFARRKGFTEIAEFLNRAPVKRDTGQ